MSKPLLIAFEGIDGCGKSTQLRMLGEYLAKRGRKSCSSAEPTNYPTGKMLRRALSGEDPRTPTEMAAMFTLDRIHHNVAPDGIRASLAAGLDVLTDRYYYSSLAYQGSLCDYEWVRRMNVECPDIRRPDLCIFLDLPPKVALSRIGQRGEQREIYEKEETLTLVRSTFLRVFETLEDRVAVIDAQGTAEEVAARVIAAVEPLL